jgi:hypothetical protein
VISAGSMGWSAFREGIDATLVKTAVATLGGPVGIGAVSAYEKLNAVGKLLKHTETLLDVDERIAREQPIQDGYSKELEQIDKLIEKCKKESQGGPPSPQEPTPPKPKMEPPTGKKGGGEPTPGKPPTTTEPGEPPTPAEPVEPGGGETPPPTEPPKPSGGGTEGLPIDCGCKDASTAAWRNEETGLSAIAASLSLLQGCTEKYADVLRSFQADSAGMVESASAIVKALEIPGEEGFEQFRAAVPGLEAAEKSWEGLSKAATEFSSTLAGCDKKMPEATELTKRAGQALGTTAPGLKSK